MMCFSGGQERRVFGEECLDERKGRKEEEERMDQTRSQPPFLYFFETPESFHPRDLDDLVPRLHSSGSLGPRLNGNIAPWYDVMRRM